MFLWLKLGPYVSVEEVRSELDHHRSEMCCKETVVDNLDGNDQNLIDELYYLLANIDASIEVVKQEATNQDARFMRCDVLMVLWL